MQLFTNALTGAAKVVFVHTYVRFRLGKWERVRPHFRSLPQT